MRKLFLPLLSSALLLAACGGGGSPQPADTTPPKSTAYQGQYYWVLFTDLAKPETSVVGEGTVIFNGEYKGREGQMLGDGTYLKARPMPEMRGEAFIGELTLDGQKALTNAFFHESSEVKSYLIAIDADGAFSPDEKGNPFFAGEAATFNLSGDVETEGYFGMVRTNVDPNAKTSTLSSNQKAVAKARLMAALETSQPSLSRSDMGELKDGAAQLERLRR